MRHAVAAIAAGMRRDGHPVSPGEAVDAARATAVVDVRDRELVRLALEAALVKSLGALPSFHAHFERVFRAPPRSSAERGERGGGRDGEGRGAGRPGEGAGSGRRPSDEPPEQGAGRRADPHTNRVSLLGRPHAARRRGDRPGQAAATRAVPSKNAGEPGRWELSADLSPELESRLLEDASRRVTTLRIAVSRRLEAGRRGRLFVQRALRANARYGGIPVVLPRRVAQRRPPRLVLALDVSHSVARASGLMLLLARALMGRLRDLRVLLFVDRAVDATVPLRRWLDGAADPAPAVHDRGHRAAQRPDPRRRGRPGAALRPPRGGPSFADVLAGLEDLAPGAPSDYGRALWTLLEHARGFRGRTVLWIVGDARTNRFDPYAFALEELRGRVDRVVWFVPEPRARWCTGDSALAAYAPHVHAVYEASTLIALAEAVRDAIAHL